MARVAATALDLCHFDLDGTDVGAVGREEPCEAACYDCLLSYYNQPDHQLLDRRLIRPLLAELASSVIVPGEGAASAAEHAEHLRAATESDLERAWLAYVRDHGYRLPEAVQPYLEQARSRPDFAYWSKDTVVFVDGPWHDHANRTEHDKEASERLRSLGLAVVRFPEHADEWPQVFDAHRHVFGEGTG